MNVICSVTGDGVARRKEPGPFRGDRQGSRGVRSRGVAERPTRRFGVKAGDNVHPIAPTRVVLDDAVSVCAEPAERDQRRLEVAVRHVSSRPSRSLLNEPRRDFEHDARTAPATLGRRRALWTQ